MSQIEIRTMDNKDLDSFQSLPSPSSCRLIDFESWVVVPGIANDTFFLHVFGTKPWISLEVQLSPYIYIERPEYWGIEIIACQNGFGLPVEAPYSAGLDVTNLLGTKGIELIGATRRELFTAP